MAGDHKHLMLWRAAIAPILIFTGSLVDSFAASGTTEAELERHFTGTVRPFVETYFENRGNKRTQSILDRVKEEASSLSRKISAEDNRKLDEYLTSVREVEKRVDRMRTDQAKAEANAKDRGKPMISMPRPDNGLPEDIRDHMRLMCDVVALAFQTDKTRIATLVLCRDLSGLFYPFLGVRKAHHSASHDDLSDDYEAISRYYVGHLAYLAAKLDAMPEGEGTVLDHTCLLWLSNMWSGYKHDNTK